MLIPVETGQNLMTLPKTNNKNIIQTTRMSVQISLTGLSFLVTDANKSPLHYKKIEFDYPIAAEELQWNLEKTIKESPELNQSHEKITVIHASNLYTVVPQSLFDESRASDFLKFNTKILTNDYVGFDTLSELGMVVVYLPFISANNYLFDTFGSFDYYHASTRLLDFILNKDKFETQPRAHLHIQKGYFDCIVVKNGKLELANSYSYKTPEDFIYFVLFCFEQLGLNPNEVETLVSGTIDMESPLYDILYTYIRNVYFQENDLIFHNHQSSILT